MARAPFAEWRGPISNETPNGMHDDSPAPGLQLKGVVVHIMQGSETGTDSWFHNPKAQASAHFGVCKDGHVVQWVDTHDKAWAEVNGNPENISVENEGMSGERLTDAQIVSNGKILAWVHKVHAVPIRVENADPEGHGLKHHSLGGVAWCDHPGCPGAPIIAQKPDIVSRAQQIADMPAETSPVVAAHPAPTPQPAPKPAPKVPPKWYHRMLAHPPTILRDPGEERNGFQFGDDVRIVQRKVGARVDGFYGEDTKAHVKGWQKAHKLADDGIVGPNTAEALGN